MADEDGNPVSPEITTSPIASITGIPVTWSSVILELVLVAVSRTGSGPSICGNDSDGASGTSDTNKIGTFTLDKLSDLGDFIAIQFTYKISQGLRGFR